MTCNLQNDKPSNTSSIWSKVGMFFLNPKNLFWTGLLLVFALTLSEVARGRELNFMIFAESTKLFWQQIAPYGDNWSQMAPQLDFFLYGPLFNILFAPFAYLPSWLGPFVWNLFNFTMWFIAIFTLPGRITQDEKCKSFLFTFLILAMTQLSMQYNVAIGYIYIFAYSLLERDRGFWAIFIIMISGFTKVYGIFQLAMLLFYPRFGRNLGYIALIAVGFLLAPAINMPIDDLTAYYGEWIGALTEQKDTRTWMTIFYLKPFNLLSYQIFIQIGVLLALAIGVFFNIKKWNNEFFRIASLAILMGYIIIFGNSSEPHTYVITLIGYQFWYWTMNRAQALTIADKILYWLILIIVIAMPIDILCPPFIMKFCYGLQLNIWILVIMWLRICYTAFIHSPKSLLDEGVSKKTNI